MVAMTKELTLTKEQAEDFYKEHKDQDYFEELTTRMSKYVLINGRVACMQNIPLSRDTDPKLTMSKLSGAVDMLKSCDSLWQI